jgi:hypothetical protein
MPPTWRARLGQRQGARAALNRPRLVDDGTPEPVAAPRDPHVDYPPLRQMLHPTWYHVYRIEATGPVLIAECKTETAAIFVMHRERWRTRMKKWRRDDYESFHPLKPGA